MARAALDQLKLERILFIPTSAQHYRNPAVASNEHRLAMLRLAIGGEPRYEIDTRELAPGATGYTVDTLVGLHLEKPYLLMGADQYAKLGSWHRPEEVRRLSRIAVFARPGYPMEEGVRTIALPMMNVSASEIRARVARGEDISAMVPPAVARHIAANRLYR